MEQSFSTEFGRGKVTCGRSRALTELAAVPKACLTTFPATSTALAAVYLMAQIRKFIQFLRLENLFELPLF